jgi:NTP pyrophosphatase (non-canonical NTP hydrolase)
MKRVWDWVRDWWTLPARLRRVKDYAATMEEGRRRYEETARRLGFPGLDHATEFVMIASRCAVAEAEVARRWDSLKAASARAAELEAYVKDWNQQRALDAGPPGLTAGQIERLAWLAEECGEVAQAVGKILRHGYQSASPFGGPTNRVALERELGDMRAAVERMFEAADLRPGDVRAWERRKMVDAGQWMHHQDRGQGSGRGTHEVGRGQ